MRLGSGLPNSPVVSCIVILDIGRAALSHPGRVIPSASVAARALDLADLLGPGESSAAQTPSDSQRHRAGIRAKG